MGEYRIRQSEIASDKGKFICVLVNPLFPGEHIVKVIYGGSYDIVERKVQKQFRAWELSKDKDKKNIEEQIKRLEELRKQYENNDDLPF